MCFFHSPCLSFFSILCSSEDGGEDFDFCSYELTSWHLGLPLFYGNPRCQTVLYVFLNIFTIIK